MIRCAVIDDEQPAIDIIVRHIQKVPDFEVAVTATNPLTGLKDAVEKRVDVIFLDIEMDELNAFDILKVIPPAIKVVLVTAFSHYAVRSYDFDVIDFLLKPVDFPRFLLTVKKIQKSISDLTKDNFIMVRTDQKGKVVRLDLNDIDFIESRSNYVAFFSGKEITQAYLSMKDLEERLPKDRFMRVHRSYIVALDKIVGIENGDCILKRNDFRIPVGTSYKDELWKFMNGRLIN